MSSATGQPAISVIIPAYNVAPYLCECLDSVRNQTFSDMEIVIVNDGSTDATGQIARDYERRDQRIRVIERDNGGQAAARNDGLAHATGQFIAFLDADDWLAPDAYETLYQKAILTKADIVRCGITLVRPDRSTAQETYYSTDRLLTFDRPVSFLDLGDDLFKLSVSPTSGLFRRSFLAEEQLTFPVKLVTEDEYFTTLAYLKAQSITAVPTSCYFYRQRDDSTMGSLYVDRRQLDLFDILTLLTRRVAAEVVDEAMLSSYCNAMCVPKALFHYQWRVQKNFRFAAWRKLRKLQACLPANCLTPENRKEWDYYTSLAGLLFRQRRNLGNLPGWLFKCSVRKGAFTLRLCGFYLAGRPSRRT